ncbi:hypothetical protein DFJ73DRAFT_816383 [Zopfochytrium polystomum]|nr:hypothetical protein DFJ73DRAFT_816383 [Zopfochytrium polystomum]
MSCRFYKHQHKNGKAISLVMIFAAAIILLVTMANPTHGLVLRQVSVRMETSTDAVSGLLLQSFGYLSGGSAHLSVANIKVMNQSANPQLVSAAGPLDKFFVGVCPSSIHSVPDDLGTSSFNSTYCSNTIPDLSNCTFIGNFSSLIKQSGINAFEVSISPIPTNDVYYFFIANCFLGNSTILFTSTGEFYNPAPWFLKNLSSAQLPLFYTYAVFCGVWFVLIVGWLLQWAINSNVNLKLHRIIWILPLGLLAFCAYQVFFYVYLGILGYRTSLTDSVRVVMLTLRDASFLSVLLVCAKGWGITRLHLSPLEKRTIIGLVLAYGVSDAFYFSLEAGATMAFAVFAVLSFTYMFWSYRYTLVNLAEYTSSLRTRLGRPSNNVVTSLRPPPPAPAPRAQTPNVEADPVVQPARRPVSPSQGSVAASVAASVAFLSSLRRYRLFPPEPVQSSGVPHFSSMGMDWDLLHSYECKLWMMIVLFRIFLIYATGTFLVEMSQLLGVFPFYYIYVIFQQTLHAFGFGMLMYVFRPRQPKQIVVVPEWIAQLRRPSPQVSQSNVELVGADVSPSSQEQSTSTQQQIRRRRNLFVRWTSLRARGAERS